LEIEWRKLMNRANLFIILIFSFIFFNNNLFSQNINLTRAPRYKEEIRRFEEFILINAPSEDAFIAVQRQASPLIQTKDWGKASEIYLKYKDRFPLMKERFDKIIDLISSEAENLVITNLGSNINTDSNEYLPKISMDGTKLFFCSENKPDGIGGEDIFFSEWQNGKWSKSIVLDKNINTIENEAIVSISPDGTKLILFGNYENTFGGGDLYFSEKTGTGWNKPEHYPKPINSQFFDADGFYTSDGKYFLFTSDRPGTTGKFQEKGEYFHGSNSGNTDIFVCKITENGFSEPINLGPVINTPYAERTPFLHPDGKTLYFSSDGHYGIGKLDVFKSTRLNDSSWIEWSEPENLGKEINTPGNDWGYQVSTRGDLAYFSSRDKSGGFGGEDIYSVTLPEKAKPMAIASIRGIVTDNYGKPLEAEIKWENLSTNEEIGKLKSDPKNGNYYIALPLGINYGYYAERKGYYPAANNINLINTGEYIDTVENIMLVEIEDMIKKNTWVRINNIFFETGKYNLNRESFPELNRVIKILNDNTNVRIEIGGHTDNTGSDKSNLELSLKRAGAVKDYLISNGCLSANITAKGFGKSVPIESNNTETGRAKNRRVEFRFIK
jgi:outer membrane protein OmpA-like peptidoglycan-associated protein